VPTETRGSIARALRSAVLRPVRQAISSPAAAPEREPDVVQVRIGRVEVRAVVTPGEPSRPSPRRDGPAPLPLDRYLAGKHRS